MLMVRRFLLLIFVVVAPPVLTDLLYQATNLLLHATNRFIDPQIVLYAAAIELVAFFFIAVLEARARWSA